MDRVRVIKKAMDVYLKKYPVLVLTGPRQSGKTTFLKNQFSDYTYVNLENLDLRKYALNDPNAFLTEFQGKVILDEVQRVPELFSYIQTKVDEDRLMGQYILSYSAVNVQSNAIGYLWVVQHASQPSLGLCFLQNHGDHEHMLI